jgi:hypothetical protein
MGFREYGLIDCLYLSSGEYRDAYFRTGAYGFKISFVDSYFLYQTTVDITLGGDE